MKSIIAALAIIAVIAVIAVSTPASAQSYYQSPGIDPSIRQMFDGPLGGYSSMLDDSVVPPPRNDQPIMIQVPTRNGRDYTQHYILQLQDGSYIQIDE